MVICAKMAEPIEMAFGLWARIGPRNHVLDGDPDHPVGRGNFGERSVFCGGRRPTWSKVNTEKKSRVCVCVCCIEH